MSSEKNIQMKLFYLYILKCKDNSLYIGHTNNLELRIAEHQEGKIPCYTQSRLPVILAFSQEFKSRDEAITLEQQIKKWSRKKKLALIENNWQLLSELAKKKF